MSQHWCGMMVRAGLEIEGWPPDFSLDDQSPGDDACHFP